MRGDRLLPVTAQALTLFFFLSLSVLLPSFFPCLGVFPLSLLRLSKFRLHLFSQLSVRIPIKLCDPGTRVRGWSSKQRSVGGGEMSEAAMDPAIKLFGRTIPLLEGQPAEEPNPSSSSASSADVGAVEVKDAYGETTKVEGRDMASEVTEKLYQNELDVSSGAHFANADDPKAPKQDEGAIGDPKTEQEQNEANVCGQGKVLKKPDKVLPCPRCNSLNTKFCYYNNYNVNQPRHFCKNCQRYWTAGGTMRNVPVGAGRRKNKHSSSHYRHILMSSGAISSIRLNASETVNNQVLACGLPVAPRPLKDNGPALGFVPEAPVCEPKSTVQTIHDKGDQRRNSEMGPARCGENGDEPSCASSLTALNGLENELSENVAHVEQNGLQGGCHEPTPMNHMQCYPGPPWSCPWSAGWNNIAPMADNGNANAAPWNPPPIMAPPAFCAPTMPFPFIPAFFWNCMSSWPNGTWNVPWAGPDCSSPSLPAGNAACSGLGKRCSDTDLSREEKSLWVPKTLRIDDPDEAAKSSIWATLGIKPDPTIKKGGIFRGFQPKNESGNHLSDGEQALHVNPAALSRSQAFQEIT